LILKPSRVGKEVVRKKGKRRDILMFCSLGKREKSPYTLQCAMKKRKTESAIFTLKTAEDTKEDGGMKEGLPQKRQSCPSKKKCDRD